MTAETNRPLNKYLRYQANYKLASIVRVAIDIATMLPEEVVKSCITCDWFEESSETCKKANARPPARVIAFGCESYDNVQDDIPF